MNLRAKIILAFGLTVLGMVALAHWASQWIVMQGFADVENRAMQTQLTRVASELRHEGNLLGSVARDYSHWDELYRFAEQPDADFPAKNLTVDSLVNLRLSVMLIYNRKGELIASHAIDWRHRQPTYVRSSLLNAMAENPSLRQQEQFEQIKSGIISLPECPMLIATAPIVTSHGEGPAQGTIVMGRWLNPEEIAALGKQIGSDLLLIPRSAAISSRTKSVSNLLSSGSSIVIQNDDLDHQSGFMTVPDVFGKPSLIARVTSPRLIYLQGQVSQRYLVAALLFSGAACTLVVWLAVYWFILRRLAKIQAAVVTVGESQQLGHCVQLDGSDELANLAAAINATLEAVRTADAARRQTDERLRHIVDSIEDVVWSMDPQACDVQYVSPSVVNMFGVSASTLTKGYGPWQTLVASADQERVQLAFENLCRDGVLDLRYRVVCPDGQVRYIHNRARVIYDTNGQPLRIDGICTDVTEAQQLTDELRRAHQQIVNDAHRAGKAEIATSVLHNVGNALNGVNVSTSVLNTVLRKSIITDFKRVLQLLVEQSDRMTEFIQSDPRGQSIPNFIRLALPLLENEQDHLTREVAELHVKVDHIQRIIQAQQENARSFLLVEETSVREIVAESLRICGDRSHSHGVELNLELNINPNLRVAKSQLVQVIVNLINNAIDAVKGPSVRTKRVTVTSRMEDDENISICVEDSGSGIPAEVLKKIFTHGFTTKSDGHGFGLHYCALAMASIGGSIQVHSDGIGKGAQFRAIFPLQHPARETTTATTKPAKTETSAADGNRSADKTPTQTIHPPLNLVEGSVTATSPITA